MSERWDDIEKEIDSFINSKFGKTEKVYKSSKRTYISSLFNIFIECIHDKGLNHTMRLTANFLLEKFFPKLSYGYPWQRKAHKAKYQKTDNEKIDLPIKSPDYPTLSIILLSAYAPNTNTFLSKLTSDKMKLSYELHIIAPNSLQDIIKKSVIKSDFINFDENLSSIECNVKGSHILLVSDEMIIEPNSILSMIETKEKCDADIVCPKILYPDGIAYCAGGIIENNIIYSYGYLKNKDDYELNYLKNVNFAHPGCILIDKSEFKNLSDSINDYGINYSSIIDFEFKVIERNGKIVYQPRSFVTYLAQKWGSWNDTSTDLMKIILNKWSSLTSNCEYNSCEYLQRDESFFKKIALIRFNKIEMDDLQTIVDILTKQEYKIVISSEKISLIPEKSLESLQQNGIEILNPNPSAHKDWLRENILFADIIILFGINDEDYISEIVSNTNAHIVVENDIKLVEKYLIKIMEENYVRE